MLAAKVDFTDDEESLRWLNAVPRGYGSLVEHTRWWNTLDALNTKYGLSFDEFDGVESGANGENLLLLQEGYVFGLAVGRQLHDVPEESDAVTVEQPTAG